LLFRFDLNNLTTTQNITHLKTGQTALILSYQEGRIASKLMAMGLLPGAPVELIRKSPFGGAYYIKSNEHLLALRTAEAKAVWVLPQETGTR